MPKPTQIEAARNVQTRLREAEKAMRRLHRSLSELRDSFKDELDEGDFVAFGGGTNKEEEED